MARLVAPGCMIAVAASTMDVPAGSMSGVHNARMTLVVTEGDGRWAITAFHNTFVVEGG